MTDLYSTLIAFEQGRVFILLYICDTGPSFWSKPKDGPSHLVVSYDKQDILTQHPTAYETHQIVLVLMKFLFPKGHQNSLLKEVAISSRIMGRILLAITLRVACQQIQPLAPSETPAVP